MSSPPSLFHLIVHLIVIISQSLNKALTIYSGGKGHYQRKREIARTTFKLGLVYWEKADKKVASTLIDKAQQLRKEILGTAWVPAETEDGFDELVSIWAR